MPLTRCFYAIIARGMVEQVLGSTTSDRLYRKALSRARKELGFHRNTLVFVHQYLHETQTPEETNAWYTVYSTVVQVIDTLAKEEIFPAKRMLGLPIEDPAAEERAVRKVRQHARQVGIHEDVAELAVRGSIERTKIAQGIYDDAKGFWKAPKKSAA